MGCGFRLEREAGDLDGLDGFDMMDRGEGFSGGFSGKMAGGPEQGS
jgi:hypothetical protein